MALDKVQKTEALIDKLKNIARNAVKRKNYEKALAALSACASVLYAYNQRYTDDELEDMLLQIGCETVTISPSFIPATQKEVQTVLFYDGFGLDTRGLAITQTVPIVKNGYKLVYVTDAKAKNRQPHLKQELDGYDVEFEYIDFRKGNTHAITELNEIFQKHNPEAAYFYSTPWDVAGTVVFNRYVGLVTRFLLDLTDHAFWVGVNAFDYITNSRAMGAYIEHVHRKIPMEKMIRTRGYLYINEKIEMTPLPFDTQRYRYVFSGGSLYKTHGDPDNYFYKGIEHILTSFDDVNYVYVGEGDTSKLEGLMQKYPNRVYYFHERGDFYKLIQGAVFYLNTYPMFGGLMMRYAANAKKIPLTLRHNNDSDGLLPEQGKLGIEFETYEEWIGEMDKLLSDEEYRKRKESVLATTVFSQKQAIELRKRILETHTSGIELTFEEFDTTKFRQEYIDRLDYRTVRNSAIARKQNICLISHFPHVFADELKCKLTKKIKAY